MGERALKFVLALRPKENRKRGENYFLCGLFFFFKFYYCCFFLKKGSVIRLWGDSFVFKCKHMPFVNYDWKKKDQRANQRSLRP